MDDEHEMPNSRESKLQIDRIVGQNIMAARKLMNLSRDELAEIMGLASSHIGLIERGDRGATTATLLKFATIFNMSVDNLFREAGSTPLYVFDDNDSAVASKQKILSLLPLLDAQCADVALIMIQGVVRLKLTIKNS